LSSPVHEPAGHGEHLAPQGRGGRGDGLLQVVFHARLAQERADGWTIDDVAAGLVDKLTRRHPHVFGGASAVDAAAVERSWDALKAAEKGRASVTEGVPLSQPSLALAARLQKRGVGPDCRPTW
jgi:XTP/dITP diphosphohydrolase